MKPATLLFVILLVVTPILAPRSVTAQVPLARVVFDDDLAKYYKDCPGPILDTLSVAGYNFNTYLGAIEFGISFPPSLSLIGELFLPNKVVSIGTSDVFMPPDFGLTLGFGNTPVNMFSNAIFHRMIVAWNCFGCGPPYDDLILVVPNGLSGKLRGAVWPTNALFPMVGGISVVCPTGFNPVEEHSWGAIKSLYE